MNDAREATLQVYGEIARLVTIITGYGSLWHNTRVNQRDQQFYTHMFMMLAEQDYE